MSRHYDQGEKLAYHMTGSDQTWHYKIDANGVGKKDADRRFYEEYVWSGMISDGAPHSQPEASQKFRQKLSLEPDVSLSVPDLSHADPQIIGPITHLLTIYSGLWLANKMGIFSKAGDHFYFEGGTPNSKADGNYVLLGQDEYSAILSPADQHLLDQPSVVVEMTPYYREQFHPAWTLAKVQSVTGEQVKVTGQLMIENVHHILKDECGLGDADTSKCWRASTWEVHPVSNFQVCSVDHCDASSTNWVNLDEM